MKAWRELASPSQVNVRRGLVRLWLVLALVWVVGVIWYSFNELSAYVQWTFAAESTKAWNDRLGEAYDQCRSHWYKAEDIDKYCVHRLDSIVPETRYLPLEIIAIAIAFPIGAPLSLWIAWSVAGYIWRGFYPR